MERQLSYQFGLILLLNLLTLGRGYSQVYTFSKGTAPYSDLVSPTNLNGTTYWDDENWVIPIGFKFLGHDTLTVSANGLVSLANYDDLVDQQVTYTISAFADASHGADLIDRDINNPQVSPINYKLNGTSASHILKIEWKNAGFIHDAGNMDFISFQLWLYEDSNKIEMHYGPHHFQNTQIYSLNNSTGPVIGVGSYEYSFNPPGSQFNQYVNSGPSLYLTGNANSPGTSSSFNSLTASDTSNFAPSAGTRFIFKTNYSAASGIAPSQNLSAKLYPNPASSVLHLEFENKASAQISFFDGTGKLVKEMVSPAGQSSTTLDVEEFSEGIYLLKIESGDKTIWKLLSIL